jgi:hypothetical protein
LCSALPAALILLQLDQTISITIATAGILVAYLLPRLFVHKKKEIGAVHFPAVPYNNKQNLIQLAVTVDKTEQLATKMVNTSNTVRNTPLIIAEDYLLSMKNLRQTLLPAYRKTIKHFTQQIQTAALSCRSHYFHDDAIICKSENSAFTNLEQAREEYNKMKLTYKATRKTLFTSPELMKTYRELKAKKRLVLVLNRHISDARKAALSKTTQLRAIARNPALDLKQLKVLKARLSNVNNLLQKETTL